MASVALLVEYTRGLVSRFEQNGDPSDLSAAETAARYVVAVCADDDRDRPAYVSNLALVLRLRYQLTGDTANLDEAVELFLSAGAAMGPADPDRGAVAANTAIALRLRYERTGSGADLEAALVQGRLAVQATADDHDHWAAVTSTLLGLVRATAERTGAAELVSEGLALVQRILARTPGHRPTRASAAALYRIQFDHSTDRADIDRCVEHARAAVDGMPVHGPDVMRLGTTLSGPLFVRYERYGDRHDIDEAIDTARQALTGHDAASTGWAGLAANLAGLLRSRFDAFGEPADLDEAVDVGRQAVSRTPPAGYVRVAALTNLASILQTRAERTGSQPDLAEAIDLRRTALVAEPAPTQLPALWSGLATAYRSRFDRTGDPSDLDDAIDAGTTATALSGDQDATGRYLANLSAAYRTRFERAGRPADIEKAVENGRKAVAQTRADDPSRPRRVSTLGLALLRAFSVAGDLALINEAIELGREAASATQPGHRLRPRLLANLANGLRARYERAGDLADLNEAIALVRNAVTITATEDAALPRRLANLSAALLRRFESNRNQIDIDEAVALNLRAVELTPGEQPDKPQYLSGLGLARFRRFEAYADQADLDGAIAADLAAVNATAEDHPHLPGYLSNLVSPLLARYSIRRDPDDIKAAVRIAGAAVSLNRSEEHGGFRFNLGIALQACYEATGDEAARLDAASEFAATAAATATAPLIRVTAAANQARLAGSTKDWAAADSAFSVAIKLLPLVSDRRIGWDSRQRLLAQLGGLASDATAIALRRDDPERAVTILEQARALLIGQALDTRVDTGALRTTHPELADELDGLLAVLNADTTPSTEEEIDPSAVVDPTRWRRNAVASFDSVLGRIRAIPEHVDFLRRPTFDELRRTASEGPIAAVNVSRYGSDAIILTDQGIQVLPLPRLLSGDVARRANDFVAAMSTHSWSTNDVVSATLDWLWDTAVGPVLQDLRLTTRQAEPTRIWWLPTGPLALLPLHAAGAAPDLVVSSYLPTLRSLALTRTAPQAAHGDRRGPSVAIGITEAGGLPPLSRAVAEAQRALDLLRPVTTDPDNGTVVADGAATWSAVSANLADAVWAHFACHAVTDTSDPSASALILYDRPLPVREITAGYRAARELAYLSACTTASSPGQLVDEAIHIASAFHLAGFRHVIGTLWRVSDSLSSELASSVYAKIVAGVGPALALHDGIAAIRRRYPANPMLWAGYVHLGP